MHRLWSKASYKEQNMTNVKEEYEKLRKKYALPSFDSMNNELEIGVIKPEETCALIKATLRMINSKLVVFINYLDPVVSPAQTLHSMYEVQGLSEEDKKEAFDLYREIFALYHKSLYKELGSEKAMALFIKEIWEKWPNLKKREIYFLERVHEAWGK